MRPSTQLACLDCPVHAHLGNIIADWWEHSMSKSLDRVDRRILDELQGDARVSNQELAKRVGLSPAPCWRRLRRVGGERFIYGYGPLPKGTGVGAPHLGYPPGLPRKPYPQNNPR